jgi:DNA-binding PadR family transcriptional regulator
MPRVNKTQYVILGLLSIAPQSGYDVKQTCDRALSHFWSEGYGSIYPILKRLVTAGHATARLEEQDGKPDRRVYEITESGRQALRDWLAQPVEAPSVRNEMLLKLFLGPQGDLDCLIANIARYRHEYAGRLAAYDVLAAEVAGEHADSKFRPFWELSLDHGRRICQTYLEWCDATEKTLLELKRDNGETNS